MAETGTVHCEQCGNGFEVPNPTPGAKYWCSTDCLNTWSNAHPQMLVDLAAGTDTGLCFFNPVTGEPIPLEDMRCVSTGRSTEAENGKPELWSIDATRPSGMRTCDQCQEFKHVHFTIRSTDGFSMYCCADCRQNLNSQTTEPVRPDPAPNDGAQARLGLHTTISFSTHPDRHGRFPWHISSELGDDVSGTGSTYDEQMAQARSALRHMAEVTEPVRAADWGNDR